MTLKTRGYRGCWPREFGGKQGNVGFVPANTTYSADRETEPDRSAGGKCVFGLADGQHGLGAPSEQERLFQQMLRNPKDVEVTFAYVKAATARGDYEAAIGALERILFYQPGLTRVKYELGSLYFRLGSYEMARRYFREALASPDIDPVTRDRIETSLPDTEKQLQQSRHRQ